MQPRKSSIHQQSELDDDNIAHASNSKKQKSNMPPTRTRSSASAFENDSVSNVSDNITVEGLRSVATNITAASMETVKASNRKALPVLAEVTISSGSNPSKPPNNTVKFSSVSNDSDKSISKKTKSSSQNYETKKTTGWTKFRRAFKPFKASTSSQVASKKKTLSSSAKLAPQGANRPRVQSHDLTVALTDAELVNEKPSKLQRSKSSGDQLRARSINRAQQQKNLDRVVRGRFDGMDILTLGCVLFENTPATSHQKLDCSYESSKSENEFNKSSKPWNGTLHSVTGRSTFYSPADMVKDMLWTSGGRATPEMILEGSSPGPEDRWSVQIETLHKLNYEFSSNNKHNGLGPPPPALQPISTDDNTASTTTDENDSPVVSTHKLWTSLWGSDGVPSGQPNRDLITQVGNNLAEEASSGNGNDDIIDSDNSSPDDPLLSLAANSNVPIDIDEDTFIVTTREHLISIQEIAAVSISEGRFDTALRILEKLLAGLASDAKDEKRFVRGATFHNIGLIHLWQGEYTQANFAFAEALKERRKTMPQDHMDLYVTQSRRSQCLFALEEFDKAACILEECLRMVPYEDAVIRAKILNNLAIVYYHKHDSPKALRLLAQALEHQREWLDGPVKRESIVYDASVSLANMGKLYLERSDIALCNSVYEEALLLQTSIFQKENPIVTQTYINLAWTKALSGQSAAALRLLDSCLRVQTDAYGADASATVETAGWMAHLYSRVERYEDALPLYLRIRQWQKQHLKVDAPLFYITGNYTSTHPSVRQVKDCIKRIKEKVGPQTAVSSAWM